MNISVFKKHYGVNENIGSYTAVYQPVIVLAKTDASSSLTSAFQAWTTDCQMQRQNRLNCVVLLKFNRYNPINIVTTLDGTCADV